MARCINCGRQSVFLKVNDRCLCSSCEKNRREDEIERFREEKRRKKMEQRQKEMEELRKDTERNSGLIRWDEQVSNDQKRMSKINGISTNPTYCSAPGSFEDLNIPAKSGSSICVYRYWFLQVDPIDEATFYSLYCSGNEYNLLPTIRDNGDVILTYEGADVCKLLDKREMVSDWMARSDIIIFRISVCSPDKYGVAVAFYRDEEERLKDKPNKIIKLTNYASEAKQDAIACCYDGQKLVCYEDDDGKRVYVSDFFSSSVIGYLPAKYAEMYLDSGFVGIFFDHSETDEEREREIPFVKIYQ